MLISETKVRVYYEDTDKMGVVYYGKYPRYYEIGRTEMIRELGFTYKELEDSGIYLPCSSITINYLKPACYDDMLTIRTTVEELPKVRFVFKTEIYNQNQELLNRGEVVLVFFNAAANKPCRAPESFIKMIEKYF
ncbi:MAG: acyl-CoA thioesterase [Bacteroidales bacterium]|jgi:acyl-CoA thioester hydrolase|nr:acyl-CoA thioesterase [Bacteroidales bacterium]